MDEIWEAAAAFLANRMKTRHQLEQHLQSKGYEQTGIVSVVAKMEEYGYLNDANYAAVYLSHGMDKGHGIWRIKRELAERGVLEDDIQEGIHQYIEETNHNPMEDEYQRGKRQADKILGEKGKPDRKLLAKAGRKLVALGYRSETVYAILGEFMRETEDE